MGRPQALDALDRRILEAVQRDCRRSPERMAEDLAASPASIRRRLNRLRERGVIAAEVALLDPALIEGVEIIVAVTMKEESRSGYAAFRRMVAALPEIRQCYSVTGDIDVMLHVHMPDMATFERWVDEHILADAAVLRCTSHVVYSRMKFETAVALDPRG